MERIIKAERFIEEVRKRPAIWKINSREYADRDLKNRCWMELADIFTDDEILSEGDKFETVKLLRRKWKSFRDCFARENNRLRQEIIEGQVGARKTQYVYYKQLVFLNENDPENAIKLDSYYDETNLLKAKEAFLRRQRMKEQNKSNKIKTKTTPKINTAKKQSHSENDYRYINFVDSFEVSNNFDDYDEADITQPIVEIDENPRKKFKSSTSPKANGKYDLFSKDNLGPIEVLPIINGKPAFSETSVPPNDTDRQFLMSLLEPLKSIPEKKRFGLKVKLMDLIQQTQAEEGILNGSSWNGIEMEDNYMDDESVKSGYSSGDRSLILLEPEMEIVELQ